MPKHSGQMDLSSSMSLLSDRGDSGQDHFRWDSIKTFMYFAFSFSSSSSTFDMFSKVVHNVRLLDFIIVEVTLGMTYMFMDVFIKQYTKRLDFNQALNPLLKGITYGAVLQSAMWALLHAADLTDAFEYLSIVLLMRSFRSACEKPPAVCVDRLNIGIRCEQGLKTRINDTSIHIYYMKSFNKDEGSGSTTRIFAIAIVWICNFFFSSVSDDTLLKISKLTFLWRVISTCSLAALVMVSYTIESSKALIDIMSLNSPPSYQNSVDLVTYIFGIGFIGMYDFQMISPYMMVDNAVILFTLLFTIMGFIRSFIIRVLYQLMKKCVLVDIKIVTHHYLIFSILPLGSEYFSAHKLYLLVIYSNILTATIGYLSTTTLAMSKLLHREFRSLKNIYIIGILCFIGFAITVPLSIIDSTSSGKMLGLKIGVHMTVLYIGGFKVALVMWIYGVKRFSTDIHYWLGFKPTKFWIISWSLLPIILFGIFVYRFLELRKIDELSIMIVAAVWFFASALIVFVFQIRTIAKYMVGNHFINAFRCSRNYGPPDREDREKRRNFSETLRLRKCSHKCRVFDDTFDCNHMPLMMLSPTLSNAEQSSDELMNIYVANKKELRASMADVDMYL